MIKLLILSLFFVPILCRPSADVPKLPGIFRRQFRDNLAQKSEAFDQSDAAFGLQFPYTAESNRVSDTHELQNIHKTNFGVWPSTLHHINGLRMGKSRKPANLSDGSRVELDLYHPSTNRGCHWNFATSRLTTNISVGTPPKTLLVDVDFFQTSELILVDKNATMPSEEACTINLYSSSDSSTCVDQNKNTSKWRLMKDTFKIGSVSGNVSIKVEEDRDWIALLAGTMGLSAFYSSIDNSSGLNFVNQLGQMGVNSPVSFAARNNSYNHHLTIGGLDSENCYDDWTFAPNIANYSTQYPQYGFNGSSIDATDPKGAVIASIDSNEWTVPCNGSLSGNVVLNVKGSGRVVFTPSDYIAPKLWWVREGDDYDNNSGYYMSACIVDVKKAYSYWIDEDLHVHEYILAGYPFYRNHCLAHNYKTGEFGIATSFNNDGIKYY
ncbi:hypothetical protein DdX_18868 [Ditylenchus destructor]|uniref:Peptidase A1 domain-containing protein n=1 Tax=Ditylenchus destructor TaxID=166010 RepID=A0AAD4MJW1_9BILA|nr:hypothetical protein DdX_18868 [Ditylenchus destructor]